MVQAPENWADVTGVIMHATPDPFRPEYWLVVVRVDETRTVEGYPNMVQGSVGEPLAIVLGAETAKPLADLAGDRMTARVRRASPFAVFADDASVESYPAD